MYRATSYRWRSIPTLVIGGIRYNHISCAFASLILRYLSYTVSNSPARLLPEYLIIILIVILLYSMADPPLSTTSEPLPIAIIGMYVETHATISFIHFHRRNSFFLLLLFFILTKKTQKITKTIGAGIAGLALAIGLHNNNDNSQEKKKKKIPFILYEDASEFSAVGYVYKLS